MKSGRVGLVTWLAVVSFLAGNVGAANDRKPAPTPTPAPAPQQREAAANHRGGQDDNRERGNRDSARGGLGLGQEQLVVGNYRLVHVERQGREYLFTFRASLKNRGPAVSGATADLVRPLGGFETVDGQLTFGPVAANGSAPSQDTFSFKRRSKEGLSDFGQGLRWNVVPTTGNRAPVANAGADATVAVGARATLSGAGSSDPDGNTLTYRWRLVSRPAGSAAALQATTGVSTALTPDLAGRYVAELVVNDGFVDSTVDAVFVSTQNSAPVAHAGADASALVGDVVRLDGSASSDVDGDPLTFRWAVVSRPTGSLSEPMTAADVRPTFRVDKAGSYRLRLVVNDRALASPVDDVEINTRNSAPVANAGADAHAFVGDTVTLDGSGSSDVDGNPLSYAWALTTVPTGSAAALDAPTAVTPQFLIDRAGTYVAQLIVSDGTATSVADTVVVETRNSAPTARAGDDQAAVAGARIALDGSLSSDPDGTPLTYQWSLTVVPTGSRAVLVNPQTAAPWFTADRDGQYVAQLVVSDGALTSAPDTVVISTTNTQPLARAGDDQLSTPVGEMVSLNGAASTDADGHTLTFQWALLAVPAGSTATLSDATAATPSFVADRAGDYVAQLVVSDGLVDSAPDTVLIRTANRAPVANAGLDQSPLVGTLVSLDGSASSDPDEDELTFAWQIVTAPAGSTAALASESGVTTGFTPDVRGQFVLRLTVTDLGGLSASDDATVDASRPGQLSLPASVSFSPVMVGSSAQQTLTVTNVGDVAVASIAASATGDFTVNAGSSCLAGALGAGASCDLLLTFAPTTPGARTGTLTVTGDGVGSPQAVTLSGDGVPPPVVSATATDAAASEFGPDNGTVTLTRTGSTSNALTVLYLVGGTGHGGSDYTALSGSATFASGQSQVVLTVTPLVDALNEGAETVTVTMLDGADYDVAGTAAAVSIEDAYQEVSVVASDASASEVGLSTGAFTVSRLGATTQALTVNFTLGGNATPATDFAALGASTVIPAGQASVTLTLTPLADGFVEGAETATLTLANGAYVVGTPAAATVTIDDLPAPLVSVAAFDAAASEVGPDAATFRLTRTGNTAFPLAVQYSVAGGSANDGSDFAPMLSGTVVFGVGQATVDITITPVVDAVIESTEDVSVTMLDGAHYDLGTAVTATVTIVPMPSVTIEVVDGAAGEVGANTGLVRFHRTGDLSAPLTATYTLGGTATLTTDYTTIGTTVSFGVGQASVDRLVTPVADSATEGDETVGFTLVDGATYDLGATASGTVTIADTPIPQVSVVALDPTASELTGQAGVDTGTFRFTRTGDVSAALVVTVIRTGTAVPSPAVGTDYSGLAVSFTFTAGQATADRVITPVKDALVEGAETVIVTIVDGANYDLGTQSSATITITD